MARCPKCGGVVEEGYPYCGFCGEPVLPSTSQTPASHHPLGGPRTGGAPLIISELSGRESRFGEFLKFQRMLTPLLIQGIFWVLSALAVLVGLALVIDGAGSDSNGGLQVLGGVALIFLGPFAVRLFCEWAIIFFRMNDTLTDIRRLLQR